MKHLVNLARNKLEAQSTQHRTPVETPTLPTAEGSNRGFVFWEIARLYDFFLIRLLITHTNTTSPEFWDAIRNLLEESGQMYRILAEMIQEEIESTTDEQFLLRANTGATLLLSSVIRRDLTALLEKHMNPIIQSANNVAEPMVLDGDPEENKKTLEMLSTLLKLHCSRFIAIDGDIPQGMRYLFHTIRSIVGRRFPESARRAVATIVFHRLITPALVSPANFNSCRLEPIQPPHNSPSSGSHYR